MSSHSSHHPQESLLAQFSLYVHKSGLKPHSFHLLGTRSCCDVESTSLTLIQRSNNACAQLEERRDDFVLKCVCIRISSANFACTEMVKTIRYEFLYSHDLYVNVLFYFFQTRRRASTRPDIRSQI